MIFIVFLRSNRDRKVQHKFKDFLLLIEHEASEKTVADIRNPSLGTLQLFGDMLTKFSEKCRNGVVQTNSLPKSEIQVNYTLFIAKIMCLFRFFVGVRLGFMVSTPCW